MRRQYFSTAPGSRLPVVCEKGCFLNVVSCYSHLGGVLIIETSRRLSIAHGAFTQHRRLLYKNKQIPWAKRIELFQTLILSKLAYGLESWTLSCQRSRDQFHAGVMRLYRRVLGGADDGHLTDHEILSQTGLPQPSELLRRARLRYWVPCIRLDQAFAGVSSGS